MPQRDYDKEHARALARQRLARRATGQPRQSAMTVKPGNDMAEFVVRLTTAQIMALPEVVLQHAEEEIQLRAQFDWE